MSSIAIDAAATAAFVQVFDAADFAGDLGPRMTCTEADTIAQMLRALGAADTAERWLAARATEDDVGDEH